MTREENALMLLRSCYGYDSFRGHQWDIIDHTLDSGDSIVAIGTIGSRGDGEILEIRLKLLGAILVIILKKLVQLGEGDSGLLQPHNLEHLGGTVVQLGTFLVVGVEVVEVDIVVPLKNHVFIFHHRTEPVGCGDNLVGADLPSRS